MTRFIDLVAIALRGLITPPLQPTPPPTIVYPLYVTATTPPIKPKRKRKKHGRKSKG